MELPEGYNPIFLYSFVCLFFVAVCFVSYMLVKQKRLQRKTKDEVEKLQTLPDALQVFIKSFDDFVRDYKNLSESQNEIMNEYAQKMDFLLQLNGSLEKSIYDLKETIDDMKAHNINNVEGENHESVEQAEIQKPVVTVDRVSYNAAVDAWIHINEHLRDLGKDRWCIQHIFSLLAGNEVEQSDLQSDLASLDNDERKEEVSVIISDIRRFMIHHKPSIELWLSQKNGSEKLLKDAVRFPINMPFDNEMDEELTGEIVEEGTIVSKVASLGYYFPDSNNGCYRVKSKIIV